MNFRSVLAAVGLAALLAPSSVWAGPAGEQWKAVSMTAVSVTGDVTFSPQRITFGNSKSLPLAAAGALPDFQPYGKKSNATLYRVTTSDDPVLLNGNRLCGVHPPQPVTYIAVWKPALIGSDVDPRGMAVFCGGPRPTAAGSPNLFGTYALKRAEASPPRPKAPFIVPAAAFANPGDYGKYCLPGPSGAYDMLIVRHLADGNLRFGFQRRTWQGNFASAAGTARGAKPLWTYADGMNSPDPSRRCAVTIQQTADGGYRISMPENARCEYIAGNNAALYGPEVFPPASRTGDAPARFEVPDLMDIPCGREARAEPPANQPAKPTPPGEQWTAYSNTAIAITGNVTFSPERITFGNGKSLPLAPAGSVPDYTTVWGKRNASLFSVTAPDDPVLLNGNRLCGRDSPQPVTFIVISIPPPAIGNLDLRAMDVFSGAEPPRGVETPHFCGNYNFERTGQQGWSAAVSRDRTTGNIHGKALDGKTMFYGACNTRLAPGLSGSIDGYAGNALGPRVDDARSKLVFMVRLPEASPEFSVIAHYYGPDKAWVWSDSLPPAFTEAFGRGDLLTILNARGEKVAEFDLKGAGKAKESVRPVCR